MKIIVTGATGFVGRAVVNAALDRGHTVVAAGGARTPSVRGARGLALDMRETADIERLILDEFPGAIVNCAAVASIAGCDADPALAERLNVALPRHLAMLANHLGARFVHLSSDMVFDGDKGRYEHTDKPLPLHLYGQTKLLGEREVLKFGKSHAVVLRTTLVSGNSPEGDKGLHERLLREWAAGKTTPLFTEEIRQPVDVTNLADVVVELCERDNLSGVYHWAGEEALSRHEIGRRVCEKFGLSPENHIRAVSYADVPGLGRRPRDLSFILHPLQGKLRTRVQSFDTLLAAMTVPEDLATWYALSTGRTVTRRLVKGVDF